MSGSAASCPNAATAAARTSASSSLTACTRFAAAGRAASPCAAKASTACRRVGASGDRNWDASSATEGGTGDSAAIAAVSNNIAASVRQTAVEMTNFRDMIISRFLDSTFRISRLRHFSE